MALNYQENGTLVPGVHAVSWDEFVSEFGFNSHRLSLIEGLKKAIDDLKSAGCKRIYVDGSFVSKKVTPNDYDACWEHAGMDMEKLYNDYPIFFDVRPPRANQKKYYKGELFIAAAVAKLNPITMYINFFQSDREDKPKGVISILL